MQTWIRQLLLGFLILSGWAQAANSDTPDAQALIRGMEDLIWSDTLHASVSMAIRTAYWSRTLELEVWMDRPDATLIRIHAPAKEAGVGSLRLGDAMWNYLPRVDQTIRIPPSMMLQPWMGSTFTNDDLVRESSYTRDYTHAIICFAKKRGHTIYTIRAVPRPEAPVVWSRLEFRVRDDFIPLSITFYDERDRPVRRLTYSRIQSMGGRLIPTRWTMTALAGEESETILDILSIEFDLPLPADLFTLRTLRRVE